MADDTYTDAEALNDARKMQNHYRPFERIAQMLAKAEAAKGETNRLTKELSDLKQDKDTVEAVVKKLTHEKLSLQGDVLRMDETFEKVKGEAIEAQESLQSVSSQLSDQEEILKTVARELDTRKKDAQRQDDNRRQDMDQKEKDHQKKVDGLAEREIALETHIHELEAKEADFKRLIRKGG